MFVESIGLVGTFLILASICFKTSSFKSTLWLRILNLVGSVLFMVYGILVPAISTAILNGASIFINAYHIYILCKNRNKEEIAKVTDSPNDTNSK